MNSLPLLVQLLLVCLSKIKFHLCQSVLSYLSSYIFTCVKSLQQLRKLLWGNNRKRAPERNKNKKGNIVNKLWRLFALRLHRLHSSLKFNWIECALFWQIWSKLCYVFSLLHFPTQRAPTWNIMIHSFSCCKCMNCPRAPRSHKTSRDLWHLGVCICFSAPQHLPMALFSTKCSDLAQKTGQTHRTQMLKCDFNTSWWTVSIPRLLFWRIMY